MMGPTVRLRAPCERTCSCACPELVTIDSTFTHSFNTHTPQTPPHTHIIACSVLLAGALLHAPAQHHLPRHAGGVQVRVQGGRKERRGEAYWSPGASGPVQG